MNKTYNVAQKNYKNNKFSKQYSINNGESLEEKVTKVPEKMGVLSTFSAWVLMALGGCSAPGYVQSTEADRNGADLITEQEFNGVDKAVNSFMSGVKTNADKKAVITDVPLPQLKASESLKNFLDEENDDINGRDYSLFEKLEDQNALLAKLYEQSNFKKKIVHDIQRNLDFEAFEIPTGMKNSDLQELSKTMYGLVASLKALSNNDIEKLEKKVNEKSRQNKIKTFSDEFSRLVLANKFLKSDLKTLALISANISHGEHISHDIDAAVDLYTALHLSETGEDLYKEGEKIYNRLKQKKLGQIANGDAHVFRGGFGQNETVETVVNELYKRIREEAGDNSRHSRHTIAQEHYMQLKNIVFEAFERVDDSVLVSKEDKEAESKRVNPDYHKLKINRAIALEKYFSNKIADEMLNGIDEDHGVDGWSVALSLVPFAGIYKMIDSAPYAFADDKIEINGSGSIEQGLKAAIYQGGRWKYGVENHNNVVGSKSADIADFWAGLGGTVITAAGMGVSSYFLISGLVGGGAGTQTSGSSGGSISGGINGGNQVK